MLTALDADALRRWCSEGLAALTAVRAEIDDLNVFPVPDGDTGTNLVLSMQSVFDALPPDPAAGLAETAVAMADGALLGARGNSGVIVAQLLRGLADVFADEGECTGSTLRRALTRAADLAYQAVTDPVEGTVLSVARAAAMAANDAANADLATVATVAAVGARAALARTPSQLPALAAAGVVDAGGRGLCVLLDALVAVVVDGRAAVPIADERADSGRGATPAAASRTGPGGGYGYEVQYLLDAANVDVLRTRLAQLGDSLVVVGAPGRWHVHVHVHVDDVGAAVEAGIEAGRPYRISVTRFADQIAQRVAEHGSGQGADWSVRCRQRGGRAPGRAVVAVVSGTGLVELFHAEGAYVVGDGASAKPSTRELFDAIDTTGAGEVVLLPNDADVIATVDAVARIAQCELGIAVAVVATTSLLQGLAALAVAQPGRCLDDDVAAMTAAARATRCASVAVAARAAQTSAGACRAGDVLGLVEDEVAVLGDDVARVGTELVNLLLADGGELITVVTGADAPADLADCIAAHAKRRNPDVQTVRYHGGQPYYPVLLGVE